MWTLAAEQAGRVEMEKAATRHEGRRVSMGSRSGGAVSEWARGSQDRVAIDKEPRV